MGIITACTGLEKGKCRLFQVNWFQPLDRRQLADYDDDLFLVVVVFFFCVSSSAHNFIGCLTVCFWEIFRTEFFGHRQFPVMVSFRLMKGKSAMSGGVFFLFYFFYHVLISYQGFTLKQILEITWDPGTFLTNKPAWL